MTREEFFVDFFMNTPPYKEVSATYNFIKSYDMQLYQFKIESFCEKCGKERTFSGNVKRSLDGVKNGDDVFFISFTFTCTHCQKEEHFFSALIANGKIIKVGQHPTYAKIQNRRFIKYKNLIPKYYTELTRSVSAYSQDMSIAAFVYLRRVFENLITKKYITIKGNDDENKFINKLKEIEKAERVIPPELDNVKNQIYAILSKGIHEYDENECMELYEYLLLMVELILDEEIIKKEKAKKIEEAKKVVSEKLKKV